VLVVLGATVVGAHFLIRAIKRPLRQAVEIASRIAEGDLSTPVDTRGSDELAQLMRALHGMTGSLARDAPPLLADAKDTLANTKRLSATLGAPEQQAKIKQAVSDVADIASRAKGMTADAQELVKHMRRGKGTVGALVMDEQLFDDLQELARDLKHNPWKFFWKE